MNIFTTVYNEAIWRPLFNALVWIYGALPGADFGASIIVLTLVFRVATLPLHWKTRKAQQALALLQPHVKKIQEEYKNDREKQGRALMALYAEKNVSPFSGCLPVLIQFPILIALFQIFRNGFDPALLSYLYPFVPNPGSVNPVAFGFLDLSQGNITLGVLAALTQYVQMKVSLPPQPPPSAKPDFAQMFQRQSLYIFPLMLLFLAYQFPAALTLYWTVLNIFGILQDTLFSRFAGRIPQSPPA